MMKKTVLTSFLVATLLGYSSLALTEEERENASKPLTKDELTTEIPRCKMPNASKPKFPIDYKHDVPVEIVADFTGNGWCDIVMGVSFPLRGSTGQGGWYDIDELMMLGSEKKWLPVLKGKKYSDFYWEGGFPEEEYIGGLPDFVQVSLVYMITGGPPYVIGVYLGALKSTGMSPSFRGNCVETQDVFRWDDEKGTFKRVDGLTQETVVDFYAEHVDELCANTSRLLNWEPDKRMFNYDPKKKPR